MARRKSVAVKKGKNPQSIPFNLEFIRNRIANGETGVIEEWKKNYSKFPKSLKAALKREGIIIPSIDARKLVSNAKSRPVAWRFDRLS